MSNIVEVEIKISQLLNDLRSGLEWLGEKNSIQAKYEMEAEDIDAIRQHPVFQKPLRVFKIVDDVSKTSAPAVVEEEVFNVPDPELANEAMMDTFEGLDAISVTDDGALDFMKL